MSAYVKNWVFETSVSFYVYDPNIARREFLFQCKNLMVNLGGWEVVASRIASGTYEYEGVTPGGVYGGSSTGPYDVWANSADFNQNNSWIMLKSPTSQAGTFYVLFGHYTTVSDNFWSNSFQYWVSDQMFALPSGTNFPVNQPGSRVGGNSGAISLFALWGWATYKLYFSACPDDGSFFLSVRRSDWSVAHAGLIAFSIIDLKHAPKNNIMPVYLSGSLKRFECGGMDLSSWSEAYLANWEYWNKQEPRGSPFDSYCGLMIGSPLYRVSSMLFSTFTTDWESKHMVVPVHVLRSAAVGYVYPNGSGGYQRGHPGYLGILPDIYTSIPRLNDSADTLNDDDGNIVFYHFSLYPWSSGSNSNSASNIRLWIPGNIAHTHTV